MPVVFRQRDVTELVHVVYAEALAVLRPGNDGWVLHVQQHMKLYGEIVTGVFHIYKERALVLQCGCNALSKDA